ncbi:MAG: response regulator [Pseudomonadales bacterium]|nr:response regulator [Pseudomonadales bacterium]
MAINHALVVDDSRSARVALKKSLEEHGLAVSLCSSGEEALDFLKKNQPDVIFMDHTMPGMDGLEAVAAIKANPETAMIPVMMYTTREGEVYVGQARALGAVGVMPKNVAPTQLFETLAELKLVTDRRTRTVDTEHDRREVEQQALGISVQNLVSRILEDQHLTLRSDILRSQRTFAKEVAKEIVMEMARAEEVIADEAHEPARATSRIFSFALMALSVVAVFFAYQFKVQRDEAVNALETVEFEQAAFVETEVAAFEDALARYGATGESTRQSAIDAIQWAINDGNATDPKAPAFGLELHNKMTDLLGHLQTLGFVGRVVLTSFVGKFCLDYDDIGGYQLAAPDKPVLECDYIGHPEENSIRVSDRLSVPFSRLYTDQLDKQVRLELVVLNEVESTERIAYPASTVSADQWNAVAFKNNRVEIDLFADE